MYTYDSLSKKKMSLISEVEKHLELLQHTEEEQQESKPPVLYIELVLKLMEIVEGRIAIREALKTSKSKKTSDTSKLSCLPASGKKAKYIGNGYFGDVFLLGNTGRVAKLVNFIHADVEMRRYMKDAHSRWRTEVDIATLAGEHGIGPKVHDSYICLHSKQPIGVIIMDYVPGITLEEWKNLGPSKKQLDAADKIIRKKLDALHDLGMFHNDLHDGNIILVTDSKKNVPGVEDAFILDYGFAKGRIQLIEHDYIFLQTFGINVSGYDRDEMAKRITNILMKDGTLPPLW